MPVKLKRFSKLNPEKKNISERYSRQILLQEIGDEGQKKISQKTVAVIGIGALGTVAAELLIRAGVHNLIIIDRDTVEESNLQRQLLFTGKDIGRSKALVAKEKLLEINPKATITAKIIHLNSENINELKIVDLILDDTDNFQTRFLINDFCKKEKIPWIYAAAIKTSGYVMPILPEGACLRCLLKETSAETCDTVGVLNTITTTIASMQATLALKILLGKKIDSLLYKFNAWEPELETITIKRNRSCLACQGKYIYLQKKDSSKTIQFCGSGRYQIKTNKINLKEIKRRWEKLGKVISDHNTLQFKNIILFEDGRALIKAVSEQEAQGVYSKYVGN